MASIQLRLATLGISMFAALGMGIAAVTLGAPEPPVEPQPMATQIDNPQQVPVPQPSYRFIVRDFAGKIAVYQANQSATPQYITDFDTAALPLQDREDLKKGIGVANDEELQMLLEDYGS